MPDDAGRDRHHDRAHARRASTARCGRRATLGAMRFSVPGGHRPPVPGADAPARRPPRQRHGRPRLRAGARPLDPSRATSSSSRSRASASLRNPSAPGRRPCTRRIHHREEQHDAQGDPAGLSGAGRRGGDGGDRPIGRNNEAYQDMLDGLVELCQGGRRPGLLGDHPRRAPHALRGHGDLARAAACSTSTSARAHEAPACTASSASCCPAHDPIRLAEEIAIADHMLQGRLFVGMARGYQARWQNILCQRFGVDVDGVGQSDGRPAQPPAVLRELQDHEGGLGERPADLRRADLQGPVSARGHPELAAGARRSPAPTARPGEVDENGTIKGVCVVPEALHVSRTRSCSRRSAPAPARC